MRAKWNRRASFLVVEYAKLVVDGHVMSDKYPTGEFGERLLMLKGGESQ